MMNRALLFGSLAMAGVLVLSNYLVQFPVGKWLTYAAFTYPFVFLVTDSVNRLAGMGIAKRVVLFGFLFGIPLSFLFNFYWAEEGEWLSAVRISVASGLAFLIAQWLDILIFNRYRHLSWWLPPLISSSPSSLLDTFIFFALAFAGTFIPWVTLALGDLLVKSVMIIALIPPYRLLTKKFITT